LVIVTSLGTPQSVLGSLPEYISPSPICANRLYNNH